MSLAVLWKKLSYRTQNPEMISREADIVIAACGRAEMITKEWLKPGCIVIDVGINAVDVNACRSYMYLRVFLGPFKRAWLSIGGRCEI